MLNSHRKSMIFRKPLLILFAALVFCAPRVNALHAEFNDYYVDYSLIDFVQMEREADDFFIQGSECTDKAQRDEYFEGAQARYYQLAEYDMAKIKYPLQLARIYDYKKENRLAKGYFFRALNLDLNNGYANLYLGDYYFKRNDYKRALKKYLVAHVNDLQNMYELNYNIAIIYEKFGDLVNAQKYYSAVAAAKNTPELQNKINSIKALDYGKSEYYYKIRGKSGN